MGWLRMGDVIEVREKAFSAQGKLEQELRSSGFIQSATLIGQRIEEGRIIEAVNDLDTVIVVRGPMTVGKYGAINHVFEEMRNTTGADLDYLFAVADGPIKPVSERHFEVFYHVILHTEQSLRDSPLAVVKNSWQYEKPFLGEPLSGMISLPGVDKDMLFHSAMGIDHLLRLVKKDEGAYLGWQDRGDGLMEMKMFPLKFTEPAERLELYIYSILRCASNTLRYITGNNRIGIGLDMCTTFEEVCGDMRRSGLPREAFIDKRLLRNRLLVLSESFLQNYQANAVGFLEDLRKYVETRS
jgi:hypothetical protein